MLPDPGTLMFLGVFDVREDDEGHGMVVHVPESGAGGETLCYISVFMPVQGCLETQPAHILGMVGVQQSCCLHQFPLCLIQSKWFLFQIELCSQPEKYQL